MATRTITHRRTARLVLFPVLTAAIAAGCLPEKRIAVSPDGSRALVRLPNDDYLLLEAPDFRARQLNLRAQSASWLPDNERVAASVIRSYPTWASMRPHLSADDVATVEQAADRLVAALAKHDASKGEFDPAPYLRASPAAAREIILCARDRDPDLLRQKLGDHADELAVLEGQSVHLGIVSVGSDGAVEETRAGKERLAERMYVIADPTGQRVAVLIQCSEYALGDLQPGHDLYVAAVDKLDELVPVAKQVGRYVAWDVAGRRLAWFTYEGGPPSKGDEGNDETLTRLGALRMEGIDVVDDGKLNVIAPDKEHDVAVMYYSFANLAFTKNGTIVFAAMPMRLPAAKDDISDEWTLYQCDSQSPGRTYRLFDGLTCDAIGSLSGGEWAFALSPNEGRILLPADGRWIVHDSCSNNTHTIADIETDSNGITPTWRTDDEFFTVVPPGSEHGSPNRSELVLVHLDAQLEADTYRCLSRDWPDAWVKDWFEIKSPETQPTTSPDD